MQIFYINPLSKMIFYDHLQIKRITDFKKCRSEGAPRMGKAPLRRVRRAGLRGGRPIPRRPGQHLHNISQRNHQVRRRRRCIPHKEISHDQHRSAEQSAGGHSRLLTRGGQKGPLGVAPYRATFFNNRGYTQHNNEKKNLHFFPKEFVVVAFSQPNKSAEVK